MTKATSRNYDQIFYARTEEEIDTEHVPTERIRRMHVGKRTLIFIAPNTATGKSDLVEYRDLVKLYLGSHVSKYRMELKDVGKGEQGLIITKLERLTSKRRFLESRVR